MTKDKFLEYTLSTEELAVAFSLVNRPDLGKAVVFETFGELPAGALEERLTAASHSLLAHGFAHIGANGIACLSEDIQSALAPLFLFKGIIQVVVNAGEPKIINAHLGKGSAFTAHWTEQGVIHRLVTGAKEHLVDWVAGKVLLPTSLPSSLAARVKKAGAGLPMETFAVLPDLDHAAGLEVLTKSGLDPALAEALLADVRQPECRGSVSYIPVTSDVQESDNFEQPVAGLFFLKGKSAWMLAFPKKLKDQVAALLPGTDEALRAKVRELQDRKEKAFS